MGLFSFIKNAGAKVFGIGKTTAEEAYSGLNTLLIIHPGKNTEGMTTGKAAGHILHPYPAHQHGHYHGTGQEHFKHENLPGRRNP